MTASNHVLPFVDSKNSIDFAVREYAIATMTGKVGFTVGSVAVENVCGYVSAQGAPAGGYRRGAGLELVFLASSVRPPANQLSKSEDRIEVALFLPLEQMGAVVAQLHSGSARIIVNILAADACGLATGK
jgi:hypothetical protein